MGGFLAPDPMSGFTNCMHAFAFIRPTRKETQRVQKPRLRSRGHSSSSKNVGVVKETDAASSVVAIKIKPFDDEDSLSGSTQPKRNCAEPSDALSALRPRLPHQRMHFLRRLGDGGEGHIDLFRLHCLPQTFLAVKTLKRTPDVIFYKNNTRKPLEAHILQDLLPTPHPHIVQMFGYTCTPRKTMMIYEYCILGDLQDVLESHFRRQALIPEGFIWHVYVAIAKALAYLHTGYIIPSHHSNSPTNSDADSLALLQKYDEPWTPILHRDIKPENIFLRPSPSTTYPTPLLADFGLATHRTPKPYECSGTFTYQGPEIPTQTAASDLWSLGATIHAMAHGRPPMIPKSEGRSTESWEWDPRSRRVRDVEEKGYSMHLGVLMRGVLRRRMEERVGGKRLVRLVEVGRKDWGGKDLALEECAFRGFDGEGDGEFKIRGAAEKPWKRGP
ncbi:MAG: hypothetical protein Q9192_004954 [Flavoplaca navasiana]